VRNLYFTNVHSRGPEFPCFEGRVDCPIENIYLNNCSFEQTDGSEFENIAVHGPVHSAGDGSHPMKFKHIKGLHMNNTTFTA
jgi:hypothetical protein